MGVDTVLRGRGVAGDGRKKKPAAPEPRMPAVPDLSTLSLPEEPDEPALLRYAFAYEAHSSWRLNRADPIARVLEQMDEMIARLAARGLDMAAALGQVRDLHPPPGHCREERCGGVAVPIV